MTDTSSWLLSSSRSRFVLLVEARPPRVAFVVNGGPASAMGERAKAFATRLAGEFEPRLIFRKARKAASAWQMLRELFAFKPDVCYVLDIAVAGVSAVGAYWLISGVPFVVDTGDAVTELGRVLGRGPAARLATRAMEEFALRAASRVVVRGSHHAELLAARGIEAAHVPDGVTVEQFCGATTVHPLTVGLIGSSVWIPTRNTCYGWELVELARLLKNRHPVRGLIIGDGSGIDVLRRRCAEYGIADRVEFAGRVPYGDLPRWLRRGDVWLSTQTDDIIGWVRTTGKLPLYLAAGRFILASQVGEAARVLPPRMLVEFRGVSDPAYPARLAERLLELVAAGTDFSYRPECVEIAREHFEYGRLATRVADVLRAVVARTGRVSASD